MLFHSLILPFIFWGIVILAGFFGVLVLVIPLKLYQFLGHCFEAIIEYK
jgi:hypothetical protein